MPYTTLVAGTPITSSWANLNVRNQVVTPFASAAARNAAITAPLAGQVAALTDTDVLTVYNGTAWVCVTPRSATVNAEDNHSSSAFGDLSTPGPAVTIDIGTKALVNISCQAKHTIAGQLVKMGFAVSGATSLAATDNNATALHSPEAGYYFQMARQMLVTGLTAGSNTFTVKFAGASATASFLRRDITVIGVP